MRQKRQVEEQWRFGEFRFDPVVRGIFGELRAGVVRLLRRGKKRHCDARGYLEFEVRRVACLGGAAA